MWKSEIDGRVLHFELAGINNQNFIMRDVETGTWWQQVTGEAIHGPLAGRQLELVPYDEVNAAIWKREHPHSLVLRGEDDYAERYAKPGWDEKMKSRPTVVEVDPEAGLHPRDLVIGVDLGGKSRAYPLAALAEQSPVIDQLGATPFVLVVDGDGKSVRGFERTVDGQILDLYRKPDSEALLLIDAQTGSVWDFSGKAVSGPLAGAQLGRVHTLKDFWFDWQLYHPETSLYSAGM